MRWLQRWVRRWLGIDDILAAIKAMPEPQVLTVAHRQLGCGHTGTAWATSKTDGTTTQCLTCYHASLEAV